MNRTGTPHRGAWRYMMAITMALIATLGFAEPAKDDGAERRRQVEERRKLEFLLASVRAQLLRENDELKDLNDRILSLQKELARRLDETPEIARLRKRVAAIDAQLTPKE